MGFLRVQQGYSKELIAQLNSQGFNIKTALNAEAPEIPEDITEVDDEGLMHLFSRLTERASIIGTQLACAIIDETSSEKEYDLEHSMSLLRAYQGKTSKDTLTILKAQVETDPSVLALERKHQDAYYYRKLVEVVAVNVDRELQLVSRELTRRTNGASFRSRMGRTTA